MIGSTYKKFAAERGLKTTKGVAYGSLSGYPATLCEGNGWKRITLTCRIGSEAQSKLHAGIDQRNILKEFRVKQLDINGNGADIVFLDNPGTMKKIVAFLDWFLPLMDEAGASGLDVCVECGNALTDGKWKLINGEAFFLHEACAQRIAREAEAQKQEQGDCGSYLSGFVGALLGAVVGAAAWALLLKLGYVASAVGLLIGFLALKGYDLMGGKQGKGKIAALLAAIIAGVVLGTFGGYSWQLLSMIHSGEIVGWTWREIPQMLLMLLADGEFVAAAVKDILIGLVFAALGSFGLVMKTGKQVAGFRMIDLE